MNEIRKIYSGNKEWSFLYLVWFCDLPFRFYRPPKWPVFRVISLNTFMKYECQMHISEQTDKMIIFKTNYLCSIRNNESNRKTFLWIIYFYCKRVTIHLFIYSKFLYYQNTQAYAFSTNVRIRSVEVKIKSKNKVR